MNSKGKILVTGGAGYIGSHTIVELLNKNYDVVSADNHVNSYSESINSVQNITGKSFNHYHLDLCQEGKVYALFRKEKNIVGIIHFAALKSVDESIKHPDKYYNNNIKSLFNVLNCAEDFDIKAFVFSSSCTVYGNVDRLPVTEKSEFNPAQSIYGKTKQIGECILHHSTQSNHIDILSLRYFNPAGAHPSGKLGEAPKVRAANLIPSITETVMGKRNHLTVYGTDYPTRDGSCIRDYIHVMDLASAHEKALDYILSNKNKQQYQAFNLGIGKGVTVLEAIKAFESTTNIPVSYKLGNRRPGDLMEIYADPTLAKKELNWSIQYNINDIMETAWKWEKSRPF